MKIYVLTHKNFTPPPDPLYVPLHVGRARYLAEQGNDDALLSFLGDDTGDSISAKNDTFSELTGLYWIWKNSRDDIVGTSHYRRYLLNDESAPSDAVVSANTAATKAATSENAPADSRLLTAPEIARLLKTHDLITTKTLQLNHPYYDGFAENHKILYLDETAKVIRDLYPNDAKIFETLVHKPHTYFGNMLIAKKPLYDAYMQWLFDILFELDRRIVIDEPDSYHRRIYGFISEFLLYVWVKAQNLRAKECVVGMVGEKAEITVIKAKLRDYFAKGDYKGARDYFLAEKEKRPDITMQASDITGELHLAMQVIATAGLEDKAYGDHILRHITDFDALMRHFHTLNQYTIARLRDSDSKNQQENLAKPAREEDWYRQNHITPVARQVSEKMFADTDDPYRYIPK